MGYGRDSVSFLELSKLDGNFCVEFMPWKLTREAVLKGAGEGGDEVGGRDDATTEEDMAGREVGFVEARPLLRLAMGPRAGRGARSGRA